MTKINNKKTVFFYKRILMVLLVGLLFLGAVFLLLKPILYILFSIACTIGITLIFYTLIKIKTFEYENSGRFISIKQSYLWKINPPVKSKRFPNDILVGFNIRKGIFTTYLLLFLRPKEQETKKLYCLITGLSKRQILELKQSLQYAKEYVDN